MAAEINVKEIQNSRSNRNTMINLVLKLNCNDEKRKFKNNYTEKNTAK